MDQIDMLRLHERLLAVERALCITGGPSPEAMAEVKRICAQVCRETGVTVAEIRGHSRKRVIVLARHEAWRRLRAGGMSISAIGRAWGVHHTSVMHALS